jgi:hypothetical protein
LELGLLELIIFLRTSTPFALGLIRDSPFGHDFHSPHRFSCLHIQHYSPGIDDHSIRRGISFLGDRSRRRVHVAQGISWQAQWGNLSAPATRLSREEI